MNEDVFEAIEQSLDNLSEEKFIQVLALLDGLPESARTKRLYEQARTRMQRLRPLRRPTLQRLFCLPFEDLLINARKDGPQPDGRILRNAMGSAWRLVLEAPNFNQDEMEGRLRESAVADRDAEEAIGRDLWRIGAAQIIALFRKSDAVAKRRDGPLGPNGIWRDDIAQIGRALELGDTIQGLKRKLPPAPIRLLDEESVKAMRWAIVGNARGDSGKVFALLSVLMVRVSPPSLLLERLAALDLGIKGRERVDVMTWLSSPLAADLQTRAATVADARKRDAVAGAAALRDMALALLSTEGALVAAGTGKVLGEQALTFRDGIKRALDETLDAARADFARAHGDGDGDGDVPGPVLIAADRQLMALRMGSAIAPRFGKGTEFSEALREVVKTAQKWLSNDLRALRMDGSAAATDSLRARLYRAVRMIELAALPADADTARRNVAEALAALEPVEAQA